MGQWGKGPRIDLGTVDLPTSTPASQPWRVLSILMTIISTSSVLSNSIRRSATALGAQRDDRPAQPSPAMACSTLPTGLSRLVSSVLFAVHDIKKSSHAQTATDEAVPVRDIPARLRPS